MRAQDFDPAERSPRHRPETSRSNRFTLWSSVSGGLMVLILFAPKKKREPV